ncbi:hypothetical protein VTJ04DRAFT_4809 [Mycothermus thermophilus]|uniref:uncharacterized protein n=1 Tax=Humicola insolens TaxID=85995 RepID=UPI003742A7CF
MASPGPTTDSFGVPLGGLNPSTENAIKLHMMDIARLKYPCTRNDGDVLAIITFPKDSKSALACDGEPWHDIRLRMSSEKLRGLGSKVINDMFSPRAQARFRRRHKLDTLPSGVDYVLDFTPPVEGPELADLTAALWLPRVVKIWFLAGLFIPNGILCGVPNAPSRPLADKAVGAVLTLGHDDVCKAGACFTLLGDWEPNTDRNIPGIFEDNPSSAIRHIPEWRKVDDYCPIRHRVAIARVLKAINGEDLLLNSAVRMWTVAQVALSLEVPQIVVDPVTQWLVAPPNTKFIEICPERAFQLAYLLKIPSVLVAAFRILVNELAVDYAHPNPGPGRPPLTWAQRRRDEYGDYPSDPVEYASRAMVERMNANYQLLLSDDLFDLLPGDNKEWKKLKYYGTLIADLDPQHLLVKRYNDLLAALKTAMRHWVNKALKPHSLSSGLYAKMESLLEHQRRHYIPAAEYKSLFELYLALHPQQRILTPFFWSHLEWPESERKFTETFSHVLPRPLVWYVADFNAELECALQKPPSPAFERSTFEAALRAEFEEGTYLDNDFITDHFFYHLRQSLSEFSRSVCGHRLHGYPRDSDSGVPFLLSDHLILGLSDKEMNYLPIWAGGLDDGSGGVFQEVIPPAEMGPSEPGPAYHTGYTAAGTETDAMTDATFITSNTAAVATAPGAAGRARSTTTGTVSNLGFSELSLGSTSAGTDGVISMTTQGRSLAAQHSEAAASTPKGEGARSVALSMADEDAAELENAYAAARIQEPTDHQAHGKAIEKYVNEIDRDDFMLEETGDDDLDVEFDEDDDDDGTSTLDGFEDVGREVEKASRS